MASVSGFFPKSELTGRRWVVKFNPLLLMSRLISINLQPADQTDFSTLLREGGGGGRRREEEEGGRVGVLCHQTFMTQKVCLMGWKILPHLELCGSRSVLRKNASFQLSPPVDWKLGNYKQCDQSRPSMCPGVRRPRHSPRWVGGEWGCRATSKLRRSNYHRCIAAPCH